MSVSAAERLDAFLSAQKGAHDARRCEALTPDASTRFYFRVVWRGQLAVAAVYPEPFDPEVQPFLDVTKLLTVAEIPVPEIYEIDGARGVIVQEDLGDEQLAKLNGDALGRDRAQHIRQAISIIADIQAATDLAYTRDSIACRLAFDEAKLIWELQFFVEHYFRSLRREELRRAEIAELMVELNDVAAELSARPRVLCHRDYHTANLILDSRRRVRVVDYQDARMGPASYDLVSLLLDRLTELPRRQDINEQQRFFLRERAQRELPTIDAQDFADEFLLMTVQRCLKAAGTFSNQTANFNRGAAYARFIRPTLLIVIDAAERLGRFPMLRGLLGERAHDEIIAGA